MQRLPAAREKDGEEGEDKRERTMQERLVPRAENGGEYCRSF